MTKAAELAGSAAARTTTVAGPGMSPTTTPAGTEMTGSQRPATLALALALVLLCTLVPHSSAKNGSTTIYDTVLIGEDRCSIEIDGGPGLTVCAGVPIPLGAVLTCLDGTLAVNDPVWFLDGAPIGSGLELTLNLGVGPHTVSVSCGSCEDEIVIDAVDCTRQPRLDALYSDDATEAESGIFLETNAEVVSPLDFPRHRFAMRPFALSIDADADPGVVVLESIGDNILQAFSASGTLIPLPSEFPTSELPIEFLINGTGHGEGRLQARYEAEPLHMEEEVRSHAESPLVDEVRVRVGPWPGLSGHPLAAFPHFLFVDSFNEDGTIESALDPSRHSDRVGYPYDVYVVEHRSSAEWAVDNTLIDVTGTVESAVLMPGSIADNVLPIWGAPLDAGPSVSRAYDIVYDFGQDGTLDPGDLIDGLALEETPEGAPDSGAGAYVVRDLSLPGVHSVASGDYSGGTWLTQRVYYPADIASLGRLPLVTIGHGNGHSYNWYNYLGNHLASHGFVVMSYRNNTGPGIETASTTTLTNIDYLLTNLASIQGGVLVDHIETSRIGWIGHSRGGEGVVRAYDRLYDGAWSPQGYGIDDVRVVASIAPTVYLTAAQSDPHEVNYYLIVGAADGDVTGRPDLEGDQYFRIADRSLATSLTTYIHGATHNDFNCCGFDDGIGPDQIGRAEAQLIAKSYFLALMQYYLLGSEATFEYFTRMYDDLRPSGIDPDVEIAATYREVGTAANFVIDDFQTQPSLTESSSLGQVLLTVANAYEGLSEDNNASYTWTTSDPMNGMTYYSGNGDFARSVVFDHSPGGSAAIEFEVIEPYRDVRGHRYLSLRAGQGTRHPETVALNDGHSFSLTLRDESGVASTVPFGAWGQLTPLYPRTGSGTGVGWLNEMNTVRVPLASFETDGTGIDLSRIEAVRLEFGPAFGSERGRICLDDLQFTVD